MKFRNILFFISLIGSFFLSLFLHQSWDITLWMDSLFLIGLLLLVISAIMLLIEVEFFVAFIKSFTHFFSQVNRKQQVIQESEKRSNNIVMYEKSFPYKKFFYQIGILFCLISLLISTTIYYFGR